MNGFRLEKEINKLVDYLVKEGTTDGLIIIGDNEGYVVVKRISNPKTRQTKTAKELNKIWNYLFNENEEEES